MCSLEFCAIVPYTTILPILHLCIAVDFCTLVFNLCVVVPRIPGTSLNTWYFVKSILSEKLLFYQGFLSSAYIRTSEKRRGLYYNHALKYGTISQSLSLKWKFWIPASLVLKNKNGGISLSLRLSSSRYLPFQAKDLEFEFSCWH